MPYDPNAEATQNVPMVLKPADFSRLSFYRDSDNIWHVRIEYVTNRGEGVYDVLATSVLSTIERNGLRNLLEKLQGLAAANGGWA